jgi:hypothetical protein
MLDQPGLPVVAAIQDQRADTGQALGLPAPKTRSLRSLTSDNIHTFVVNTELSHASHVLSRTSVPNGIANPDFGLQPSRDGTPLCSAPCPSHNPPTHLGALVEWVVGEHVEHLLRPLPQQRVVLPVQLVQVLRHLTPPDPGPLHGVNSARTKAILNDLERSIPLVRFRARNSGVSKWCL